MGLRFGVVCLAWLVSIVGCGPHTSAKPKPMPKTTWEAAPKKEKGAPSDAATGEWAGLDVANAGADGEAVDLVPVPHKLTVFDFWAPWCKPCGIMDHQLAEMVHKHAKDIAVRKLNVVDWDSAAAQRYLGDDAALPHIVVFSADGKQLIAESGPPAVLVADIEELLEGE